MSWPATSGGLCKPERVAKLIPPVVAAGTLSESVHPELDVDHELRLRPWRLGDVGAIVEAYASPDIQRYHFRRYDTEEEAAEWIAGEIKGWSDERSASWAVIEQVDGNVVGRVSVYLSLEDGHGEVAYWVLPKARGRRVATRACRRATQWAHDLGLHRVQLEHSTTNEASRRIALACGFREEGTKRGANLHDDGWHDMILYSRLATDED